jgi:hypothetical protein
MTFDELCDDVADKHETIKLSIDKRTEFYYLLVEGRWHNLGEVCLPDWSGNLKTTEMPQPIIDSVNKIILREK